MRNRFLKYFYFCCLFISVCLTLIKGTHNVILIIRAGFTSNFFNPNSCFVDDLRCCLVLPWYLPYVNMAHFWGKAYKYTQNEKEKTDIVLLATSKDIVKQQSILDQHSDSNVFIRLYKKYWPIDKFVVKFRTLTESDVRMNIQTSCTFIWLLFLAYNILLYFMFKNELYGFALLASCFCSLRLLLVFCAGVAWADLLLYNKKLQSKHALVCPYVLLSSASSFCLIIWVCISKFTLFKKIFICVVVSLLITPKLTVNNTIANNAIANNAIANNTLKKINYFLKRCSMLRDFSVRNYTRACFLWIIFVFFCVSIFKAPNRFLISSFFALFLEGLVPFFALPLWIKSWFRE